MEERLLFTYYILMREHASELTKMSEVIVPILIKDSLSKLKF